LSRRAPLSERRLEAIRDERAQNRRDRADRRDDRARRTLEMVLDRLLSPADWAARAAYAVGLQGGRGVETERHLIPLARARSGPPLRVAFASDFHAGATTSARLLENACRTLADLAPDVLLLGGDFVTVRAAYIDVLAPLLATIPAPFGKFAVFGNHDLRADTNALRAALDKAGVTVLSNEAARLRSPHEDVTIAGLDDPIRGVPNASMLDATSGVRIVIMHAPDGLLTLGDREFDLALCGHTHGGQIVLPTGTIPYLPAGKLSRTYPGGLYRLDPDGRRALLVSRGVGCSTVPIRLRSRAQVHLLTVG
jgi:predicted MPP superfamily phosphohydrolase